MEKIVLIIIFYLSLEDAKLTTTKQMTTTFRTTRATFIIGFLTLYLLRRINKSFCSLCSSDDAILQRTVFFSLSGLDHSLEHFSLEENRTHTHRKANAKAPLTVFGWSRRLSWSLNTKLNKWTKVKSALACVPPISARGGGNFLVVIGKWKVNFIATKHRENERKNGVRRQREWGRWERKAIVCVLRRGQSKMAIEQLLLTQVARSTERSFGRGCNCQHTIATRFLLLQNKTRSRVILTQRDTLSRASRRRAKCMLCLCAFYSVSFVLVVVVVIGSCHGHVVKRVYGVQLVVQKQWWWWWW